MQGAGVRESAGGRQPLRGSRREPFVFPCEPAVRHVTDTAGPVPHSSWGLTLSSETARPLRRVVSI